MELKPIPPKLRTILESNRIRKIETVLYDTSQKFNGNGATIYGRAALEKQCLAVANAADGTRNDTLNTAAFAIGQLIAGGELEQNMAFQSLINAAAKAGLSESEAERTAESGLTAGMEHPRSSKRLDNDDFEDVFWIESCPDAGALGLKPAPLFNLLDYSAEDGGILDLWCDLHGRERLFAVGFDSWFVWKTTHWDKDEFMFVEHEIEQLMDAMNAQATAGLEKAKASGDKETARIYTGYITATKRSKNRVGSVEGMARARCATRSAILNNGNTLNLRNGVLDLEALTLQPHTPDAYLTYCLPYDYDPVADCPRFKQFVGEVMVKDGTTDTDPELCALYQEALGYALTTDTRHESMFWFSGDGGNGKTVAITMLQKLLGPLCFSVSFEEMGRAGNYDLADVAGKRVIFSTESERGGKLAEGHIKRIVSGERINARPIYGSPFEFQSTAKVFWGMNDLPVIRDTSNGVWRRLKLIPFLRTFTEKDRDPHLIQKLEAELSGILNYALEGLRRLRDRGRFSESQAMQAAVNEYRQENNPIQQWLDERTQPTYTPGQDPQAFPTPAKLLFDDYKKWAEENGRQTMNSTNFGREMRRLKIPKKETMHGNAYALILL